MTHTLAVQEKYTTHNFYASRHLSICIKCFVGIYISERLFSFI